MINCTCKNCGKVFPTKPSQPREHCSRECQKQTGLKKRQRICRRCGKQFEVNTSSKEGKYCGFKCSSLEQRVRVTYTCQHCGKRFEEQPSERRKYCCHRCSLKAQRGRERKDLKGKTPWNKGLTADVHKGIASASRKMRGENHPNWKGGKTKYYGPDWNAQSRRARRRDGYKCRHCGVSQKKLGRKLDVHHIKPFKGFGYIQGENDNYIKANRLKNLISLCHTCHGQAEWGNIAIQPNLL